MDIRSLALNLVALLLFSLISTFVPKDYIWFIFIIYAIIIVIFTGLLTKVKLKRKEGNAKGTLLFKTDEKSTMELVMRDNELIKELNKQTRGFFLILIVSLLLLFIVVPRLYSILILDIDIPPLERFLRYLGFYGIMWGIMYGVRAVFMPKRMIMPVTKYEVLSTGIRYGRTAISFPLDQKRYKVYVDHKRGFVELHDLRTNQAHRLYTQDTHKLYSLIEKYGLRGKEKVCGSQST